MRDSTLNRSALVGRSVTEKQKEEAKIALHEEGESNAALQCNTSKGEAHSGDRGE